MRHLKLLQITQKQHLMGKKNNLSAPQDLTILELLNAFYLFEEY